MSSLAAPTMARHLRLRRPTSRSTRRAAARPRTARAFLDAVRAAIDAARSSSLVLSKPRTRGGEPKAVRVRRIVLQGAAALSFVAAHATRDVTRNLASTTGSPRSPRRLDRGTLVSFAHATLHAAGGDRSCCVSKKGQATLRRHARAPSPTAGRRRMPAAARPAAPHDRARARRLSLDLPFLAELGLTDASHRLVPAMARKWRQIDKFLEVLDHALERCRAASRRRAARRCASSTSAAGKGYLTFAVHEHLRRRFGVAPEVPASSCAPSWSRSATASPALRLRRPRLRRGRPATFAPAAST